MKKLFVFVSILVVASLLAVGFGLDRQTIALAQDGQPPVSLPEGLGGSSADQAAQGGNSNAADGQSLDGSINADYPERQMSYQGKLVQNGVPFDGTIDITFRLYWEPVGGTVKWTETQTVSVDNGLFSVMLGSVNPLPVAQQWQFQMYLGIQPDGAASELTPRQLVGTVGSAMNLIPGTTVVDDGPAGSYTFSFYVDTDNHQGIFGGTVYTDAVGVQGTANGPWGGGVAQPTGVLGSSVEGLGVSGYSSNNIGVQGQGGVGVYGLTNDQSDTAVLGYTGVYSYSTGVLGFTVGDFSNGMYGLSIGLDSPGVNGIALGGNYDNCFNGDTFCNAGVVGTSFGDSYGMFAYSDMRSGILGYTNDTGFYAGYFDNLNGTAEPGLGVNGYAFIDGDLFVTGSKAGYVVDVAFNAGSEPLQQGDVVVVVGADAPIMGNIPVMRVQKATPETAYGVVGVVDVLYENCEKAPEELQASEACGKFRHDITTVEPGQYLGVVTLGAFAYVKADASNGAIQPGDLLSVSPTAGVAGKATMLTVDGVSFFAPGTIIGKALGGLDSGSGLIPVFISIR